MRPVYKSLALAAMTLQVSLALNAETRDDESASTMALQAELLDSLRVELVAQNVSGARNLVESGECVIDGSNLTITLDTSEWTRGAMYRVQVLATFGTQTQVIYALNVTVPYYVALSDTPQEYEDTVTVVSTITDVTEADLEGLALEETSQEIKAAITPISQAADAYNVGKTQLAAAITSKGVETSPTETYPEMAEKVNAISQETYEINGGEMYAKQLFGSLETPNYWNLYEVLANLLSDGRLVNYGGILLAEYYRGYDSLALSGAGAGGAYVVSDKDENGQFIMYTSDATHTWDTDFDGKCNRWVAYCFADEYHDFQITDTNTSPRNIFIGRKVGIITNLAAGRAGTIVIPDGNELIDYKGAYSQDWNRDLVIRNINEHSDGYLVYNGDVLRTAYIECDSITGGYLIRGCEASINSIIIKSNYIDTSVNSALLHLITRSCNATNFIVDCPSGKIRIFYEGASIGNFTNTTNLVFYNAEDIEVDLGTNSTASCPISIYYNDNDKTKTVTIKRGFGGVTDLIIKDGWCKPLDIKNCTSLKKANVQTYIFDRLGVNDLSTGAVTITLANAVLNLFTQEEIDAVVERTNITIVGA